MDRIGTSISCLLMIIGWKEGPLPIRNGVVALGGIAAVFLSCGIVLLASFQFTTRGYLRTHAALHVATVTISLWRNALTACKSLILVATPSAVLRLTDRMTAGMISRIFLFVNNLFGEFTLVVSAAVNFIFFLSLV